MLKKVTGSQQGTVGLAKTVWSFIDLKIKKTGSGNTCMFRKPLLYICF